MVNKTILGLIFIFKKCFLIRKFKKYKSLIFDFPTNYIYNFYIELLYENNQVLIKLIQEINSNHLQLIVKI